MIKTPDGKVNKPIGLLELTHLRYHHDGQVLHCHNRMSLGCLHEVCSIELQQKDE